MIVITLKARYHPQFPPVSVPPHPPPYTRGINAPRDRFNVSEGNRRSHGPTVFDDSVFDGSSGCHRSPRRAGGRTIFRIPPSAIFLTPLTSWKRHRVSGDLGLHLRGRSFRSKVNPREVLNFCAPFTWKSRSFEVPHRWRRSVLVRLESIPYSDIVSSSAR
jgi:hypothetical protein